MKTYGTPQQEIIAELKPKLNVNFIKERNLRILYSCLGIGIVLLVAGLVLLLTHQRVKRVVTMTVLIHFLTTINPQAKIWEILSRTNVKEQIERVIVKKSNIYEENYNGDKGNKTATLG